MCTLHFCLLAVPSSVHFIYISCKAKDSGPSVLDTTKHFFLPHVSFNVGDLTNKAAQT